MQPKFYWLNPKIESKNTNRCGDGLFAKKTLKKGDLLVVCGGYVLTLSEEEKLEGKASDNGVQISDDLVMSISKPEEYGGYNFFNLF